MTCLGLYRGADFLPLRNFPTDGTEPEVYFKGSPPRDNIK